jgi:hypothetical protein
VEDEEIWRERRRQQSEEVAIAVERAKQRKEEEEKRYQEQLKQVSVCVRGALSRVADIWYYAVMRNI